ncbi:hypothetical protein [Pandoraea commovens]|uniref:Transmembrane protein n=1 Tax=Pandoraea commovens TaxID=2508289 RepID=A0A5E4ZAC9_9BURK|nr:hypothetical protein [Pandoraea commovens]VVE57270.1 hypothetical protein PCO31010_05179 [Pandoraea commovens]
MSPATKWVLLEALLPLFGATLIYGFLGAAKWLVTPACRRVKWAWGQAFDSMGWLYGGAILAVQSGLRGVDHSVSGQNSIAVWICFGTALLCGAVVAAGMITRGEIPEWKPPGILIVFTCVLMAVIVVSAYNVQDATLVNGVDNVRHTDAQTTCR